uniref:Uncharacterized protein n=1 Tax=Glossina austeni TaxID=7395 RepID=A0A1A9UK31_GLOAU
MKKNKASEGIRKMPHNCARLLGASAVTAVVNLDWGCTGKGIVIVAGGVPLGGGIGDAFNKPGKVDGIIFDETIDDGIAGVIILGVVMDAKDGIFSALATAVIFKFGCIRSGKPDEFNVLCIGNVEGFNEPRIGKFEEINELCIGKVVDGFKVFWRSKVDEFNAFCIGEIEELTGFCVVEVEECEVVGMVETLTVDPIDRLVEGKDLGTFGAFINLFNISAALSLCIATNFCIVLGSALLILLKSSSPVSTTTSASNIVLPANGVANI